jgi:DNA (cytosine-5)-methyltransferase 1
MIAFENSRRDGVRLYNDKTNTLQAFAGTGGGNGPCVAIQGNMIGRDKGGPNGVGASENEAMYTLTKTDIHAVAHIYENHAIDSRIKEVDVSPTVRAAWGTGGGNVPYVQSYGFEPGLAKREGNPNRFVEEMAPTLRANMGDNQIATAHAWKMRYGKEGGGKGYLGSDELAFTLNTQQDQQIAVAVDTYNGTIQGDTTATMTADMAGPTHSGPKVMQRMAVRRLTPKECERLQGFPDDYTNIKENCPDGHRYKAMGNSMAVPVMEWIGKRIQMVEDGLL